MDPDGGSGLRDAALLCIVVGVAGLGGTAAGPDR
jgi:uncharacterized damage-inducible protein DinB